LVSPLEELSQFDREDLDFGIYMNHKRAEVLRFLDKDLKSQVEAWTQVVAMRNRLIHVYFDVNLDIVREATQIVPPPLVDALRSLLFGK
jgi:hypothetical protein